MSRPVTIVIPARSDRDLLERHLPALFEELERRGAGDEVLVIDDTGDDVLRPWISEAYPSVRGVVHRAPRGWGKSLLSGARVAKHALVLGLAPDVLVREGFLDPLVEALDAEDVFAVSPRLLPSDDESAPELWDLSAEGFSGGDGDAGPAAGELPSVNRGVFLTRREDLLEHFTVEATYEPVFVEPLATCLSARARGQRVLEVEESVVEHHPREGAVELEERTAFAKNRLLAVWTHLDDPERSQEHLDALWRFLSDSSREGWDAELAALVLALDQLPEVAEARGR